MLSKYDIKSENSSTLSKFREGGKRIRSIGSNADVSGNQGKCFSEARVDSYGE